MTEIKQILFLGDEGVGKTSLIKLFLTGTFPEGVEKVIKEQIVIDPKKFGVIHYYNYIELKDCSNIANNELLLQSALNSNVVVLLYDLSNVNSFSKLKSEIIPLISVLDKLNTVIVVGNKYDLLDSNSIKTVIEQDKADLDKISEEEIFASNNIDIKYHFISSKNHLNISGLFHDIISSQVNLNKQLFYSKNNEDSFQNYLNSLNIPIKFINKEFNHKLIKALIRIFRILDRKLLGYLEKKTFEQIHIDIFQTPVTPEHLNAIEEVVRHLKERDQEEEIINSMYNQQPQNTQNTQIKGKNSDEEFKLYDCNFKDGQGMSLKSFILLNLASVYLEESQITWAFLRKFGYNDDLELDDTWIKKTYITQENNSGFLSRVYELSEFTETKLKKVYELMISLHENRNKDKPFSKLFTQENWNEVFISNTSEFEHQLNKANIQMSFDRLISLNTFNDENNKVISIEEWLNVWSYLLRTNPYLTYKLFLMVGNDLDFNKFALTYKKSLISKPKYKTINCCFVYTDSNSLSVFLQAIGFMHMYNEILNLKKSQEVIYLSLYVLKQLVIISFKYFEENQLVVERFNNEAIDIVLLADEVSPYSVGSFLKVDFNYIELKNKVHKEVNPKKNQQVNILELNSSSTAKFFSNNLLMKIKEFRQYPLKFLSEAKRKELLKEKNRLILRAFGKYTFFISLMSVFGYIGYLWYLKYIKRN